MECSETFLKNDILRLCTRKVNGSYYLNLVDSGLSVDDTEPIECWETYLEEDIWRLLLTTDSNGDYAINCILVDPDGDYLESVCGEHLSMLDILRERIVTDGTNWYLLVNGVSAPAPSGGLELTFVDLSTNEFSGFTTVNDWNTFFNLPANGTPFTSVSVNGNTVTLLGGGGITLDAWLFSQYYYPPKYTYVSDLVSIVDNDGVIEVAGENCFSNCTTLTTVDLPALITVENDCFRECSSLSAINIPITTTIGTRSFRACTPLSVIELPLVTIMGDESLIGCTLTTIDLSSCTNLGASIGDDFVFNGVTGNTITLTVPAALMTCDGGNPDGDIAYLQANNTVTVIQV